MKAVKIKEPRKVTAAELKDLQATFGELQGTCNYVCEDSTGRRFFGATPKEAATVAADYNRGAKK